MHRFLTLLALAAALLAVPAHGADYRFALFGDTPYSETERARLPLMLKSMARDTLAFAVHVGDIKNGGSRCSDEIYQDRLKVFNEADFPLIYIPGDNEWTDCHRLFAGLYDPLERLGRLREIFFPTRLSLGHHPIPLDRQGDAEPGFRPYRENVRWERGRVLFVGLNIPGSANNRGEGPDPSPEFVARSQANRSWLASSFSLAHERRDTVIFVIIQANPDFEATNARRQNLAYGEFLRQLTELTLAFPGRVFLVHGDTHNQHIDQPLRNPATGKLVRKFTRIETFGAPYMGWTEVQIRNADTSPRISIQVIPFR